MSASFGDGIVGVTKLPTGIPGFDSIAMGGLPAGRATLVTGAAGSGKTILAAQFLAGGIARGENAVFVTFEETPRDICQNLLSIGWDISRWVNDGRWAFVDASPQVEEEVSVVGNFDLGGLMARIEHAVRSTNATRVSVDSLNAVFTRFDDHTTVRRELHRLVSGLKHLGVTGVLTAERTTDLDGLQYAVEEFVADNVVVLRNTFEDEKRRRTIEILKFRGTIHQKGAYPFTVLQNEGIVVIPLSAIELTQKSSSVRISSGNTELDALCGGGFFRDSVILVSGATGTGKTLLTTEFIGGGSASGERCLMLGYEESREQMFRNAVGWGRDFTSLEREGRLRVACVYPESIGLEEHLLRIKSEIEVFNPTRVALDSLSAIERVANMRAFREFVIDITSFIKEREIAGLFTATTPTLLGGQSVTESHISTITDSIILLRYVELYGEMRRGLTVLKMRGSPHDKQIREFSIDSSGLHIGLPFRTVSGILSGNPRQDPPGELDRLSQMFEPRA
ncbi:MAG: circadian clock protein KaiC [Chloroflexota bacterium]